MIKTYYDYLTGVNFIQLNNKILFWYNFFIYISRSFRWENKNLTFESHISSSYFIITNYLFRSAESCNFPWLINKQKSVIHKTNFILCSMWKTVTPLFCTNNLIIFFICFTVSGFRGWNKISCRITTTKEYEWKLKNPS